MNCPHKILGVSKTATLNEIKQAYRRLALQLHPDTNGGDPQKSEQFKLVASAYEILSNPESKKKWEFEQKYNNYQHWDMSNHTTSHPFHGKHTSGGFHFNEDEWNAFHYGIDIEDFDFNSPDEFVIDMSTGKVKRSARKNKTNKNNQKSKNGSHQHSFHEFSQEEVEEMLKYATRSPKNNSKKSSHSTQQRHQGNESQQKRNDRNNNNNQQPKKNSRRSNRRDNDCTIS